MTPGDETGTRRLRGSDLVAMAPAGALAALSLAFGTFPAKSSLLGLEVPGGASAVGAICLHLILLAAALFAAPAWRQPLALGRRGRLLLLALWAVLAAASWASPVPRAGRVAVVLMPAWLLVPAAVARCWPSRRERRWGLAGVATVVAIVAVIALADRFLAGSPRAAMPLGHHNLLAVWLLALLPAAALPLRRPGPARWLAVLGVISGGAALLATGSLAGAAGSIVVLAVMAVGAASRGGEEGVRRRPLIAVVAGALALAATALAAPRLLAVVGGTDGSLAVRATYYGAGLRGFLARPFLGWGPGATPWTIGEWLEPVPGVNPPYEVVGDLHSLPLQLLYELGLTGLLLALAVTLLFPWRRLVSLPVAVDRGAVLAGLLGLLGAGMALLAVAPLAMAAIPAALAVAAGAALAGEARERTPLGRPRAAGDLLVVAWVLAAAFVLFPLDRAHLAYDRAIAATGPGAARLAMDEATRFDPTFPLYRARLALLAGEDPGGGGPAAAEALAAAEAAWGVGALWLAAGDAASAAGEPWAAIALERACHLNAFGGQAPYLLALADPGSPMAPRRAARALAAEPRLAAAVAWRRLPWLREAAVAELTRWEGIEPGWRLAIAAAVSAAGEVPAFAEGVSRLALVADRDGAGSLSLHLFRRRPLPFELVGVGVESGGVRHLGLPAASTLASTSPEAFGDRGCRDETGPPGL
ncbi:MAG TPA: O-antigen ligase family protein [Thermoanaerobaculia bacterium]|nr:O-antigen ligase family protein [Thermoanaerobaculia bacterium]